MKRCLIVLWLAASPLWAQAPDLTALGLKAAKLRGLSYHPIASQLVSQKECAAYLLTLLNQEMEPRRTRMKEGFLKAIGLMPPKASMKAILSELYTDQVRGLYDPAKKRYLVVRGGGGSAPGEAGAEAMGLSMTDILAVHELGHAIQDQHFNLVQISHAVEKDSDREFAAQSLIEGDATVLMMDYAMGAMGMDAAGLDPGAMAGLDLSSMTVGNSPALARAPRYFRELLTVPYTQGMVFVAALKKHGGWKAVDQAFTSLPPSSEDIFHPEKYLRHQDAPHPVSLAKLPVQLNGCQSLGDDTAGAFTVRVLAQESGLPVTIADGWIGDRYRTYASASGEFAVWSTLWNSDREAQAFEGLARKSLTKRWGQDWTKAGLSSRVERAGKAVKLWLGVPTAALQGLPL